MAALPAAARPGGPGLRRSPSFAGRGFLPLPCFVGALARLAALPAWPSSFFSSASSVFFSAFGSFLFFSCLRSCLDLACWGATALPVGVRRRPVRWPLSVVGAAGDEQRDHDDHERRPRRARCRRLWPRGRGSFRAASPARAAALPARRRPGPVRRGSGGLGGVDVFGPPLAIPPAQPLRRWGRRTSRPGSPTRPASRSSSRARLWRLPREICEHVVTTPSRSPARAVAQRTRKMQLWSRPTFGPTRSGEEVRRAPAGRRRRCADARRPRRGR